MERVSKIAISSSLHGLSNLIRTESIIFKIVWFACLIVSGSVCCFLINRTVVEYFRYDVTTKIRLIQENEVDFPAVAICNSNPFVTTAAVDHLIQYIETYTNYTFKGSEDRLHTLSDYLTNDSSLRSQINYAFYGFEDETKKTFGLPIDQIIFNCHFKMATCNLTNFKMLYHWNYGLCYVFNSENDYKLTSSGIDSSLSLELFSGFQTKIPYFVSSIGFQIIIYNQTQGMKFNYYFQRISIKTNTETHIAIKRNFIDKLKMPYSECEFDEDTFSPANSSKMIKKSIYKKKNCMLEIYRQFVYKECNCVIQKTDVEGFNHTCLTSAEIFCASNLYNNDLLKNKLADKSSCPLECDTQYFTYFTSFEYYPSHHYGYHLFNSNYDSNNITYNEFEASIAKVNIFYNRIGYQCITEMQTMTSINLLASTGGMFGLFMGMSLLSFIELFEMTIELIQIVLKAILCMRAKFLITLGSLNFKRQKTHF